MHRSVNHFLTQQANKNRKSGVESKVVPRSFSFSFSTSLCFLRVTSSSQSGMAPWRVTTNTIGGGAHERKERKKAHVALLLCFLCLTKRITSLFVCSFFCGFGWIVNLDWDDGLTKGCFVLFCCPFFLFWGFRCIDEMMDCGWIKMTMPCVLQYRE